MGTPAQRPSPVSGCPPSYLGGSQTRMAQSSPTEVTRTASGGSGTSEGGRMVRGSPRASGKPHPAPTPQLPLLTHNPQEDGGHVLAHRVGDLDGVAALVRPIGTLDHEAAGIRLSLNVDPALGGRVHLDATRWPCSPSSGKQSWKPSAESDGPKCPPNSQEFLIPPFFSALVTLDYDVGARVCLPSKAKLQEDGGCM